MKYAIVTFGCRVNQADSFVIEEQLRQRGDVNASPEDADLIIVNSCSVTASADQGTRQTIRRIARSNPDARVVVTGCYATRRPDDIRELPNVVRIVGNDAKDTLVALLEAEGELTTAQRFDGGDGPCGLSLEPGVAGRTALTLRVQTGCDQECSYCIIPQTRGAGRSRPLPEVVRDVRRAVEAGYREIAITGVHLGSYGRDLDDGTTLARLVRVLSEWPDEVLFRVSSLEPMDCTPEVVDAAASSPRIADHFHLPLQHGSDSMLAAMKRPYSTAYYRALIDDIRERLPHASIGTDIIIGFPGETPAHFDSMRDMLETLPVTHFHVFPYSDRPGTAASRLTGRVDGTEIRARARDIRGIGERKTAEFRRSQVGRTLRALAVDDGRSVVTGNYLKVKIGEPRPRNTWVDVTIESANPLVGRALPVVDADFRFGLTD
jgi:threonylcarbamoyladenosine tRNA methylthiotransferase MtaB